MYISFKYIHNILSLGGMRKDTWKMGRGTHWGDRE